jgi:hypothetical protein
VGIVDFLAKNRKSDRYPQSRSLIQQFNRCVMQVGDGLDQAHAKSGSLRCPALVEAIKTLNHLLSFLLGYSRAIISDIYSDRVRRT